MSNPSLLVLFLGLMSLCAFVVATVLVVTARDVRRTLRRIQTILPDCQGAVHEAHQLLKRANQASRHVESVVQAVSDTTTQAMEQFALLRKKAKHLFGLTHHNGNGARGGPRHQHRSASG